MNIKQRALLHTVLAILGITGLSVIINIIIAMMTPHQLGLAFMVAVTVLLGKIIYDYRLAHLEYKAKLEEITRK
jgi:hypothetical protein